MTNPLFQPGSFYFLVGPTASGKTSVAHDLARRYDCDIISTDAMLVYTGMDIGTAKPSPQERAEVAYHGIDLTTPDKPFSTGDYVALMKPVCHAMRERKRPVMLTGGTGLYVKCLIQGMDDVPAADEAIRSEAEQRFQHGGIEALQDMLQSYDRTALDTLADQQNPRRLIRAIEIVAQGRPLPSQWQATRQVTPIAGLRMDTSWLHKRIADRVYLMYENGLLNEAEALQRQYPELSKTAAQAIGYREAFAVLEGRMAQDEAIEKTIIRTRQLAKRQMTWFRHQAVVEWVDVTPSMGLHQIAEQVVDLWRKNGPVDTAI